MENKNVGWLIIGISAIIFIIIWIFNYGIVSTLNATCTMGPTCSMSKTLSIQTGISIAIAAIILIIGLFLVFAKEHEKIVVKKIRPEASLNFKKFDKKSLAKLGKEEQKIMNLLLDNKGSIFQSQIAEQTGFDKVRVTRLLDSLEVRGVIERRRRGMTNIVLLKN